MLPFEVSLMLTLRTRLQIQTQLHMRYKLGHHHKLLTTIELIYHIIPAVTLDFLLVIRSHLLKLHSSI